MKKILVPTDFSACALAAENYAFQLAKKADAELVFIHIINTPVDWSKLSKDQEDFFPDTKKTIVEAKSKLNELVKKALEKGILASKLLIYNKLLPLLLALKSYLSEYEYIQNCSYMKLSLMPV